MILFDTPRTVRFDRFRRTAHLMSDLVGIEGTAELLAFGARIGMRERWIQKRGTPHEHFDLFDGRIEVACSAGAVEVTGRELVLRVIRPKREALAAPASDRRPLLHLTNLSSQRLHGPGRVLHIQAMPPEFVRRHTAGRVGALAPAREDLQALDAKRITPDEYRRRFEEAVAARAVWLRPGALSVEGRPGQDRNLVVDGDTLVCTCARDQAAAGWCHRVWCAPALVAAGWDVVLDGVRLSVPWGPCDYCEERPEVGCCLDWRTP